MAIPPETPSSPDPGTPPAKVPPPARRSIPPGFIFAIVASVVLFMVFAPMFDRTPEINYGFFRQQVEAKNIEGLDLQGLKITGEFINPPLDPSGKTDRHGEPVMLEKKFTTTLPAIVGPDMDKLLLENLKDKYKVTTPPDPMYFLYLFSMVGLPLLMLVGIF